MSISQKNIIGNRPKFIEEIFADDPFIGCTPEIEIPSQIISDKIDLSTDGEEAKFSKHDERLNGQHNLATDDNKRKN